MLLAMSRVALLFLLVHVGSIGTSQIVAAGGRKCDKVGFGSGRSRRWIWSQNRWRLFDVFVPEGWKELGEVPLVVLLHGSYSNPDDIITQSGMEKLASAKGFAFVAPAAEPDYRGITMFNVYAGLQAEPGRPDDVRFVHELVEAMSELHCIDRRRVFCTGYSNGGRMCSRLGSELCGTFAAVAPVSGVRYPWTNNCTRDSLPVLAIHGELDPINTWQGNSTNYWFESVPEATGHWAKFDRCTPNASYTQLTKDVWEYRYSGCKQTEEVVLTDVKDGGHTWPGTNFTYEKLLGPVDKEIDATAMIWSFFEKHPMPPGVPPEPTSHRALVLSFSDPSGFALRGVRQGASLPPIRWLGVILLVGAVLACALFFYCGHSKETHEHLGAEE